MRRRRHAFADKGFTLAELMVAMCLMGVFMVMVAGSFVMMYGSSQRSEAVTRTSQEINGAFLWLDRHIRYADYLSDVTTVGGDPQVAFSSRDPESGAPTCFELRVDTAARQLRWRTAGGGSWRVLASGLATVAAPVPLTVIRPSMPRPDTTAAARSELWISLTVTQGSGTRKVVSESNASFAALNSAAQGAGAAGACRAGGAGA